MNQYNSLTKVFIKSLGMSEIHDKRKKIFFNILLSLVLFFIFLPFVFLCGLFVKELTTVFESAGLGILCLKFVCGLICVFTFFFNFQVILSQFYFNEDLENILSLPIKSEIILAARFTACFIAENIMQFLLIFASVVGFSIAVNLNMFNVLLSLIGIITLPIIPMLYCAIISMLIMNFTKLIKNKEIVRKISIFFVLLLLLLFAFSMSKLQAFDINPFIFIKDNENFFKIINIVFPHINLFIDVLVNKSLISFLLYFILQFAFIGLFLIIGNLLYLDSVYSLNSKNNTSKKNISKLINSMKQNSIFKSYIIKEFKLLFRSPVFFINCIFVNFVWPFFIYIVYKICFSNMTLDILRSKVNDSSFITLILLFVFGVSILLPALNSIASSSFSREGANFSFMKSIPVNYEEQAFIKVLVSFIITFVGVNIFTIPFYLILGLDFLVILELVIVSVLVILLMSYFGVFVDSIQPKLIWEDEANSLRENYNTFIVMGFALLLFIVFGGIIYYLYHLGVSFNLILSVILSLFTLFNIIMIFISKKYVNSNLIEQEEF